MNPSPNLLIIHCHDLGQYLHSYGVTSVQTPNLDRFAAQGVRFAQSFCTAPSCSPSRASIFTGRYPHNNGVLGLCHAEFGWDLHPAEQHLAQLLAANGYSTAAVGVVHETRSGAARCGYQTYDPPAAAIPAVNAAILRLQAYAAQPEQPFFLAVGLLEPHRLPAPNADPAGEHGFLTADFQADDSQGVQIPGYLRDTPGVRQELAELQGAVRHVDHQVGRLLAAVDELQLAHNTLVIFTTDHGVAMPRAKCSLYDPGLQTALLLRLPSRPGWHGGVTHAPLLSNIDYLPTLLELLGIPIPSQVQGRSFCSLLDGQDYTPRSEIFAEMTYHDYYDPRRAIRTETHKLIVNFTSAPDFMDASQSWRPRSDTVTPANHALAYHVPLELYDLEVDPWEQKNAANQAAYAAVQADLLARLAQHLQATDDPILQGAVTSPMHRQALRCLEAKQ